jgi:hypothetical protein
MLAQRDAAFVFGRRGDTEGTKDGDKGLVFYDDLSTVRVLVLSGNAIAAGQLGE